MKTVTLLSMIALGTSSISSAALAAPVARDAPASQQVRFSDLDLTTAKDQTKLKHRISSAAANVCEELGTSISILTVINQSCYRAAMADAMAQMDRIVARANDKATLAFTSAGEPPHPLGTGIRR